MIPMLWLCLHHFQKQMPRTSSFSWRLLLRFFSKNKYLQSVTPAKECYSRHVHVYIQRPAVGRHHKCINPLISKTALILLSVKPLADTQAHAPIRRRIYSALHTGWTTRKSQQSEDIENEGCNWRPAAPPMVELTIGSKCCPLSNPCQTPNNHNLGSSCST